jgi:multidrug resistance efflux pump
VAVSVIERLGWTRGLWHLPLCFVALAIFFEVHFRADLCAMRISRAHLVTFAMVALAVIATAILYWRYSTRPWTRDAQVRANVVGIAPRVAGPIIQIPIKDNQAVRKGDLLFEIDPSTFQAAVDNAQAKLKQAQAAEIQAQQELQRQNELYQTKTNDLRDVQNAEDSYAASVANTAAPNPWKQRASTSNTPRCSLLFMVT